MEDPRLDDYLALKDVARRREVERRGGFFVAEGILVLGALVRSPYPIRSVLVAESGAERVEAVLRAAPQGNVPLLVRPDDEVAEITGFAFHRGVLASADRLPLPTLAEAVQSARRIAVLEGLNDHENLGSLFRNAAAFGVEAVVLDPTTADPLYRRCVRVSIGHVLRVPWTRAERWPDALDELRRAGFVAAALTPAADAIPVDELAADPPSRLAVLVGAEGPGLSDAALRAADLRLRIPLAPAVDSLNVATATGIAFHRLFGPR